MAGDEEPKLGRNRNRRRKTVTTTYSVDSVTPVKIADVNDCQVGFTVVLLPPHGTETDVFIRYYPAAQDSIKHGIDILTVFTLGNSNLFRPRHVMTPDNVYIGEISAISQTGTVDIAVTVG